MHAGSHEPAPRLRAAELRDPVRRRGRRATPTVHVDFTYADESDPGPYPFGPDTTIEGGSDRHAIMIDQRHVHALRAVRRASGTAANPTAGSGAIFDLGSNALRPRGWTSADAAGLPIFPGLVRWDEVEAGAIDHAIRFTVGLHRPALPVAGAAPGGSGDRRCPPMGARFRLKARVRRVAGFSDDAKVILDAMKHYGLIVADNGSDWYFQGDGRPRLDERPDRRAEVDPRGRVRRGGRVGCRVAPNSAAFAYGPECPAPYASVRRRKFRDDRRALGREDALRVELHAEAGELAVLGGHHEAVLGPRRQLELRRAGRRARPRASGSGPPRTGR